MDDELRAALEAMEDRLMVRITGLQEQMLERFSAVDRHLDTIGTTLRLAVTLLGDFAKRITDLEKK